VIDEMVGFEIADFRAGLGFAKICNLKSSICNQKGSWRLQ